MSPTGREQQRRVYRSQGGNQHVDVSKVQGRADGCEEETREDDQWRDWRLDRYVVKAKAKCGTEQDQRSVCERKPARAASKPTDPMARAGATRWAGIRRCR